MWQRMADLSAPASWPLPSIPTLPTRNAVTGAGHGTVLITVKRSAVLRGFEDQVLLIDAHPQRARLCAVEFSTAIPIPRNCRCPA